MITVAVELPRKPAGRPAIDPIFDVAAFRHFITPTSRFNERRAILCFLNGTFALAFTVAVVMQLVAVSNQANNDGNDDSWNHKTRHVDLHS